MINLTLTHEIPAETSAVYVITKETILPEESFSENELQYIRSKISEGSGTISVNSYSKWSFIIVADPSGPFSLYRENLRNEASKLLPLLRQHNISRLLVLDMINDPDPVIAFVEGLLLSSYKFDKYLTKEQKEKDYPQQILLKSPYVGENDVDELQVLCEAVFEARNLVNEPLSYLTAEQLAAEIEELSRKAGFAHKVLEKNEIVQLGMGGLLSVNRGSLDPPVFSILEWKPDNPRNNKPIVLAGKGVMYDTGGMSLKPTYNSMDYMKSDMAGGASVAGVIYAVAKNRLPVHVVGLIPATDNRPDGNAIVPGDIVKMFDGTTVEVLNTDAEGRLLLADALAYAKKYDPSMVIDIATLTGSAKAALGTKGIAVMRTADDKLYGRFTESAWNVYERIVEFPLWDDYKEELKSDIADLKNVGGRTAGTITAGKFLEHFISYPWIHIDIAGPAYLHKSESYRGKGGSGVGVRLIYDFLKKL